MTLHTGTYIMVMLDCLDFSLSSVEKMVYSFSTASDDCITSNTLEASEVIKHALNKKRNINMPSYFLTYLNSKKYILASDDIWKNGDSLY